MPTLQWSDAMSVGVAALDADHRCLVRIINLLEDSGEKDAGHTIETVLDTLLVYSRYHFSREEEVMRQARFPGMEFHANEHRGFARYIRILRDNNLSTINPGLIGELHDYLTAWLRHHILIQDMDYKPFVTAGGEPDQLRLEIPDGECGDALPPA
jgi:hemerythrin-like metal-binding protein